MAYRLQEHVFLVEGALNGALFDTCNGSIHSINKQGCRIIKNEVIDVAYWETLISFGLAIRSIEASSPSLNPKEQANKLSFVWFEVVSEDCNEACIHCYIASMPPAHRVERKTKTRLSFTEWKLLIEESFILGCRRCQFIGGEPFLYHGEEGENLLDLIEFALSIGYESIEVYTNGTLLTEAKVTRLAQLGIKVAVSLYSSDETTHDLITQTPGSHKKTMRGLELLKKYGVKTRVEIVAMRHNQDTLAATIRLRRGLGFSGRSPDPIRPGGRANEQNLKPDFDVLIKYGLRLKPSFTVAENTLQKGTTGNSCLNGKIVISDTGEVFSCIFAREKALGHLRRQALSEILASPQVLEVWGSTKDSVLVCQDCEYRYVCQDCRPLAHSVNGEGATYLNAPMPRCTYNPYSGEWGKGLWVMKNGSPHYDRLPEFQKMNGKEV